MMNKRIQQLPTDIANQIAAGEVVERPASVIKELLENASDANATDIRIDIGYGGLNLIRVADNGDGIWAEDLPLAVSAHATSKITVLEDLYRIDSMGFRGEALASIASVSKLKLLSKPSKQASAMQLHRASGEWLLEPAARSEGTTVEVLDIFYNAPVRKKFLRSERNEFQAIEQIVKRFALAQMHIAIVLNHNDKLVLELAAAHKDQSLNQRVAKIMGKSFLQTALKISSERAGLRLHGWISGSDYQRSQQDKQYLYVNQRIVRDKLLTHALKQAYEGLLYPGRHAACMLYFELASAEVDVNVHPTKHELRFVQPRLVHDFILHELRSALQNHHVPKTRHYPDSVSEAMALPIHECAPVFRQNDSSLAQVPLETIKSQPINSHYVLLTQGERSYLARLKVLYQQAWQWKLQQMAQPFPSRPMLIPLTISIDTHKNDYLQTYQLILKNWGIGLDYSESHRHWVVSQVPISIPQLDIKSFLLSLSQQYELKPEQLLILVTDYISVSPTLLDSGDQQLIQQYLLAHEGIIHKQQHRGVRWLNASQCEQLFNE